MLTQNNYLLAGVFRVIECKLVKFFKLILIKNLFLQVGQLGFQLFHAVTAELYHAAQELLLAELTLCLRLELPGDDEDGPVIGVQLQVLQELNHTIQPDLIGFALILVPGKVIPY